MKNKFLKLLSVLFLTTIFVSCEDFLDTESKSDFSAEIVFDDPVKIEGVLFKAYHYMAANNSYRNRILLSTDWNTDIEQYSPQNGLTMSVDGGNDAAFSWYAVSQSNNRNVIKDGWNYIYKAIEQTNQVIDGIDKYADKSNSKVRALYAEALTLRAYLYLDLVKWWGDVPARFEPANSTNVKIPATSRDLIYERLLEDLLTAQDYIDWAGLGNASSQVTRVNKAAVKALRARIALYAAGYSQRPVSFVSPQTPLKVGTNAQVAKGVSASRELELYAIARTETKSIIDQYAKSKLLSSFTDVFKAVTNQKYNWSQTESLWEHAYRNQFMGNTMLYDETTSRWDAKPAGGKVYMVPSFFYDFETGDLRRDASAVHYSWKATSPVPPSDGGVYQELEKNLFKLTYAKLRPEWFPSGTYFSTTNDTYGHLVVIRYADVLLMYAEACLVTNVDVADGLEKFNWVRERAFGNTAHNLATLTFDDIVDERAFELSCERIRKYDLIRWGLLKTKMDEAISNVYKLEAKAAPYADVPLSVYTRSVTGPYSNSQVLITWGINRGESGTPPDAGTYTYDGPSTLSVTNSSLSNKYYLYNVNPNVAAVNDYDPEFRALYPYHVEVIASNPNLSNVYGY